MSFASHDAGIAAVRGMVWGLYDDFQTHRLRGRWALDEATRRQIARSILFLYSDAEYLWPDDNRPDLLGCIVGGATILLHAVTFGLWTRLMEPFNTRRWHEHQRWMRQFGDVDCWPFLHRAEFEAALREPRFFAGLHR